MPRWLRRTRAAFMLGLTWALAWAPTGLLVGALVDPNGTRDEPWLLIFAYPGFLGGVLFSIILAIAERRRTVPQLSVPRMAVWGGLAGFVVATVPFFIGQPSGSIPVALLYTAVAGSVTLLGAVSAAGTVAMARAARPDSLTDARADALPPGDQPSLPEH